MINFASKKFLIVLLIVATFVTLLVSVSLAATNIDGDYSLFRASVGTGDVQGNGPSYHANTSYDGRYVAFESYAQNWVYDGPANQPNYADIFLRDLETDQTSKLTTGLVGGTANDKSFGPTLSFDGRYIVYDSYASNLVQGDTNGANPWAVDGLDIFLYDQVLGTTQRVSLNYAGEQIMGNSAGLISGDGRYIVFASDGPNVMSATSTTNVSHFYIRDWQTGAIERITNPMDGGDPGVLAISPSYDAQYIAYSADGGNIVPNDTNNALDIFLYNRQTGTTTLVSKSLSGSSGNGPSNQPQITPSGNYIVFMSFASDLVPGDTNNVEDIFLYETATGNIQRVSVSENGQEANGKNREPAICEGGRYVAWTSSATNLIAGDNNGFMDVYFYDVVKDEIRLASVDTNGFPADNNAHRSSLSPDCRYIAFASDADNIILNDTNGLRDIFMGRLIWPFDLNPSNQYAPAFAEPGETLTYRVWVRNGGLETGMASFTTPIPENTTFVSGSGTNGAIYNSASNQIEWSGSVMGESVEEVDFSVLVSPGLTDTVFLTLDTQLTGDGFNHTLENMTIVNGYYSILPAFYKN